MIKPFLLSALCCYCACAQVWYDLTVQDPVTSSDEAALIGGTIHPAGILPSQADFSIAQSDISSASLVASNAFILALEASNVAMRVYHDVIDVTSNGLWEVAFTLSALRGVGASDDLTSKTVGFSVERTPTNQLCHAVQWFSDVPYAPPTFSASHSTNLVLSQFSNIAVATSYPDPYGSPIDYGQEGGVCYRLTISVPSDWGQAFFKLTATGFILRGNALPIVGGVTGGTSYDIMALDAIGLTNVILNVRGGFVIDTNNPVALQLYEQQQ